MTPGADPSGTTAPVEGGSPPPARSLRVTVASGLTWTGVTRWIGTGVGIVNAAVLGRLLVPTDFAVLAAAGALAGVLGIMQESGLAAAVVHSPRDDDQVATTALLMNVGFATLALLACFAAVPWLAAFFQISDRGALAAAFIPLWLRGWTNVPIARMQKRLAFRRVALAQAAWIIAYPAVSFPLAALGAGAWALVLGQAGAGLAMAVVVWLLVGWRPRLAHFDWSTGRRLAAYGRPILGSNLLGTLNDQIDNWVTGGLFGPTALGLYTMAFRLATIARNSFTFVVSDVLFPALTRIRHDDERLRTMFLRSVHWVAVLSLPVSAGLALLAPEVILVLLGPRWSGTIGPVRVLAVFGLLASLSATTGDVFKAVGRSGLVFKIGLVHSLTLWLGLALLGPRGLSFIALAVVLATLASSVTAFGVASSLLGLRPSVLLGALWAPAAATVAMSGAVLALRLVPLPTGPLALLTPVGAGAAVYFLALALLAREDVAELRTTFTQLARVRTSTLTATPPGAAHSPRRATDPRYLSGR